MAHPLTISWAVNHKSFGVAHRPLSLPVSQRARVGVSRFGTTPSAPLRKCIFSLQGGQRSTAGQFVRSSGLHLSSSADASLISCSSLAIVPSPSAVLSLCACRSASKISSCAIFASSRRYGRHAIPTVTMKGREQGRDREGRL